MTKIKNVVVIGGGTAGWATANFIRDTINPNINITVVASKEIPIIGVGESTTGGFNTVLEQIGINEQHFIKETGATHKIGIQHRDWYKVGEHFNSPIGDHQINTTNYPSADYDYLKIFAIANDIKDSSLQGFLMRANKVPFIRADHPADNPYKARLGYGGFKELRKDNTALHLDTFKTGQYLKHFLLKKQNVNYVDDKIVDYKQDENGIVKYIVTEKSGNIEADLFIDCSGFARVLIDKAYNNKFISYENELLNNRALAFHLPYKEKTKVRSYTHAWAQKYGWMWMIPLQHRYGCGYCFSDKHTTPEKAKEEIEKVLRTKIEVQKDIKFNAGRLDKFWIKNVLSTGLSSAFIEPLEATSIHATLYQLKHFIRYYYTETFNFNNSYIIDAYNNDMTNMWDEIKDFIVFHYITPRNDTQYWIDSSSNERWSDRLKEKLKIWKDRMPRQVDYVRGNRNDFYHIDNNLWLNIAQGMRLVKKDIARRELEEFNLHKHAEANMKGALQFFDYATKNCLEGKDYYNNYVLK
jgi:hypothetical protein